MPAQVFGNAEKVIHAAKLIRDSAARLGDSDLQVQAAELLILAADLKMEAATVEEELLRLNREIEFKTELDEIRGRLIWNGHLPFLADGGQKHGNGPFCPICITRHGQLFVLLPSSIGLGFDERTAWKCSNCEKLIEATGGRRNSTPSISA